MVSAAEPFVKAPPSGGNPYKVIANILYNQGVNGNPELGDLYLPQGMAPGTVLPVVVVIHGGDWSNKSAQHTKNYNNVEAISQALASSGIAAFAINYLLYDPVHAPQIGVWPQNLEDCKTAVQWLRVNAASYGLDPSRVGVVGTSAGAHLAALTAMTDATSGGYEPAEPYPGVSTSIQAAFLMYGPYTDISSNGQIPHFLGPGATLQTEMQATPVTYVRSGLEPIMLSHGDADTTVPIAQAYSFQADLAADGTVPGAAQIEWTNTSKLIQYAVAPGLIVMHGLNHGFPIDDTGKKDGFVYDLRPNMTGFFQTYMGISSP